MHRTHFMTAVAAVLVLAAGPGPTAVAADDAAGVRARTIVILDADRISPSELTMDPGDVLAFQNDSGQLMQVAFVEPREQMDKIRCYLKDHTNPPPDATPWLVFYWGEERQLTATIPPGTFASACTLAPGRYAFVMQQVSRDPRAMHVSREAKGAISVK